MIGTIEYWLKFARAFVMLWLRRGFIRIPRLKAQFLTTDETKRDFRYPLVFEGYRFIFSYSDTGIQRSR